MWVFIMRLNSIFALKLEEADTELNKSIENFNCEVAPQPMYDEIKS